jgi:gliding motility-associated-like protein
MFKKLTIVSVFILKLLVCFSNSPEFKASHYALASNDTLPEAPIIDYITVNKDSSVTLHWHNPSNQVSNLIGYIIYKPHCTNCSNSDSIDYINSPVVFSYTYFPPDEGTQSVNLRIAALSSNTIKNTSPVSETDHWTIQMTLAYDPCDSTMQIDWTQYVGWGDNLKGYNVYYSNEDVSYQKLNADILNDTITAFVQSNTLENTKYYYYVEAVRLDTPLVSQSNLVYFLTQRPNVPDSINANYATVTDNKFITLSFTVDPASELDKYLLIRNTQGQQLPDTLKILGSSYNISYTDTPQNLDKIYSYHVEAINSCGHSVLKSNIASNILFRASNNVLTDQLDWTSYRKWENGVDYYNIYRSVNGADYQLLEKLTSPDTAYSDDLSSLQNTNISGQFCYYVEAIEKSASPNASRSNTYCVNETTKINIANAFTPNGDGRNEVFKPEITFVPDNYYFVIYNRWNEQVFQTHDPSIGWNGEISGGKKAGTATYMYYIKLTVLSGKVIEQTGYVTVLYP